MVSQQPQPGTTAAHPSADTHNVPEQPWYAAYPEAKSEPASISRHEVLQLVKADRQPGHNFVLVDLRRTDFEGGTIVGAVNLPAQSLYPTIPALYALFHAAGVGKVIWYCGSSRGRGTRAAAWFADHIEAQHDSRMQSLVLVGGIKAWVGEGGEFVEYMQEYDPSKWS